MNQDMAPAYHGCHPQEKIGDVPPRSLVPGFLLLQWNFFPEEKTEVDNQAPQKHGTLLVGQCEISQEPYQKR